MPVRMVWSQMGQMNRRDDALKRPSFSIAEMMAIIAIVALDCLLIRAKQHSVTILFLVLGGSPMQIALMLGLLLMFRRRGRMEKPNSFLIGFEVVGWLCLLIYVVLCFQVSRSIDRHLGDTLGPLLLVTGFRHFSMPDWIIRVGLAMSYLTIPQLTIALVGGWISERWSKRTHPGPVPTNL
jgi:hypothetical protein